MAQGWSLVLGGRESVCRHCASWMFSSFGNFFGYGNNFTKEFQVYSVTFCNREDLEGGNRFILPASALQELHGASTPMLFEISDLRGTRRTHGGVLEFVAEEGRCYVPFWIIKQLNLQEGDRVRLRSKSLPKAKYVRLQPDSVALM